MYKWWRLAIVFAFIAVSAAAEPLPRCPFSGLAPSPDYGKLGASPNLAIWRDIDLSQAKTCLVPAHEEMVLALVLASRFKHSHSVEELAKRIGSVSATEGLLYWSTTEGRWRSLISEAFAIEDADPNLPRADFTAEEVLSGETLYFAQNDTRSTSQNIYRLVARVAEPERLVIEIVNLTSIRFMFATLFDPQSLYATHSFEKLGPDLWGYFGLSSVRNGSFQGSESSFVNRAAAIYRFLTGIPADREPPLSP